MKEDRLKLVADLNLTQSTLDSEKARNQTIEIEVENRMKQRHEQVINELRREVHRYQDELRNIRVIISCILQERSGSLSQFFQIGKAGSNDDRLRKANRCTQE